MSPSGSPAEQRPVCDKCGELGEKIAHDTGDGWHLGWDCACGAIQEEVIEWPFDEDSASAEDLRNAGFKIV